MNLSSITNGATYRAVWGYRFRVTRRGKSSVLGRWVSGPLAGREARLMPSLIESRVSGR